MLELSVWSGARCDHMSILSIQSRVVSGYVGNAAAVPVLQRLGRTVWPIDTVTFSNHPAYGLHTGSTKPIAEIQALVDGLSQHNLLTRCDAVLSGYLGSAKTGPVVLASAERVRDGNPAALWCCDPVMGDHGQFYVPEDIPPFFRDQALPAADIVFPNAFEAAYLSGMPVETAQEAVRAANALIARGPIIVVISGIIEGNQLGTLAADANGHWKCMAPTIDAPAYGAGDVFTALFVNHFLANKNLPSALGQAVSGIHKILAATAKAQTDNLNLIAALPALDDLLPFPVERVG